MNIVSEKLLEIHKNTIGWLKFAEAKNAILLAFAGTGIGSARSFSETMSNTSEHVIFLFNLLIFSLYACTFICALSFLPRIDLRYLLSFKERVSATSHNDNLYFFGDLQKYTKKELLNSINDCYFDGNINQPYKKEWLDITSQIIANAKITTLKFQYFKMALYFLLFSVLLTFLIQLIIVF